MKLIKDKKSILIDITNSCINKCANCMRFCQLNNNPYFMNLHDVKNAIDSLDNWNGQISIMGGEPLLHPFFKEIMKYLQTKYKKKYGFFRYPISDIYDYALNTMPDNNGKLRLFTSVPKQFYDYFEDIDDTFHSLRCNDHSNYTNHFTTMVYYKDLGISDEEFIKQSKNCWVNNDCGAVINNHGAFFCEMAGAMDMLYDGNTGFKVQKDWWKETSYQKQMYWCQFCGARLGLPMAMDNENITYMSKTVFNMLLKNALCYIDGTFFKKDIFVINGKIADFKPGCYGFDTPEVVDCGGAYVLPGFIDIHTHGANGVDVNSASVKDFENISSFFASKGTTSYLASVLTDSEEKTLHILSNIALDDQYRDIQQKTPQQYSALLRRIANVIQMETEDGKPLVKVKKGHWNLTNENIIFKA